jgi:hypothetical protein
MHDNAIGLQVVRAWSMFPALPVLVPVALTVPRIRARNSLQVMQI